jgi:tRNA pseudouridine55 synthase
MSARVVDGVLVLDKPRGPTSHDVVARMRRALGLRAIGHAGTLDPMATGVLVLALGEATKLVPWLTALDKTYEATIALGVETDTLDAEGREVRREPIDDALRGALDRTSRGSLAPEVHAALEGERRRTSQVPPAYSAIKVQGVRSFARARRGEAADLAPRDVAVRSLELTGCAVDPPELVVHVTVAKGYYVRALARDLAAGLGTAGHLTSLRRTRAGTFTLEDAIDATAPPEELRARVLPLAAAAARALPLARLTPVGAEDARHGRPVSAEHLDAPSTGPTAWLDGDGRLVAVGEIGADGRGQVVRGFPRG